MLENSIASQCRKTFHSTHPVYASSTCIDKGHRSDYDKVIVTSVIRLETVQWSECDGCHPSTTAIDAPLNTPDFVSFVSPMAWLLC